MLPRRSAPRSALLARLPRTIALLLAWVTVLDGAGAIAHPLQAGALVVLGTLFSFHPAPHAAPSFVLVCTGCTILRHAFGIFESPASEAALAAAIVMWLATLEEPARRPSSPPRR